FYYLERAGSFDTLSIYHILAAISANHCAAANYSATNWSNILSLYDVLYKIDPSPLVLLNRAIAISKVDGPERGIHELKKIEKDPTLKSYHLFHSTMAEFYIDLSQYAEAAHYLHDAIDLAPLPSERTFLAQRLAFCEVHR